MWDWLFGGIITSFKWYWKREKEKYKLENDLNCNWNLISRADASYFLMRGIKKKIIWKTWSKSQVFLFFWKKGLGKNSLREYTEKRAERFFLLFTLSSLPKEQEKVFIPYQKKRMKKEIKVMLNGAEKVVEFKEIYTRKIDREFSNLLFWEWNVNGKEVSLAPANIQKANDYLIQAMTNLTPEEIDQLSVKDFDEILKVVVEIKGVPLK